MENRSLLYFGVLALISVFGAFAPATGMDGQEVAEEKELLGVAEQCLACHGSFEDLAKATADFTNTIGETATPHQYVPHDDKEGIPKCTVCHIPHDLPLEDISTVVKPDNLKWCYDNCHHAANLQPCSVCH
jgi:hypothetical protein